MQNQVKRSFLATFRLAKLRYKAVQESKESPDAVLVSDTERLLFKLTNRKGSRAYSQPIHLQPEDDIEIDKLNVVIS